MDFTYKAHYDAGGHMTDSLPSLTYLSVVSWDIMRIAFQLVVLNDFHVHAADVGNAYLNIWV